MKITDELMTLMTERGGLLTEVYFVLTGRYKYKSGWKKTLIGQEISSGDVLKILELNAIHHEKLKLKERLRELTKPKCQKKSVTECDNNDDVPCWHRDDSPVLKPLGEYLNSAFPPWDERCLVATII